MAETQLNKEQDELYKQVHERTQETLKEATIQNCIDKLDEIIKLLRRL